MPVLYHARPAYATGIGDQLTSIDFDLAGWNLVLVKPRIHVSTREAYALVTPRASTENLLLSLARPIETWKDTVKNDFEVSVFQRYPEIAAIKQTLYDMGAVYASMSGSGASVYGLFRNREPEVMKCLEIALFPLCACALSYNAYLIPYLMISEEIF